MNFATQTIDAANLDNQDLYKQQQNPVGQNAQQASPRASANPDAPMTMAERDEQTKEI